MTTNHETQIAPGARAGVIKLGLDVHASSIVVVRQIDAQVAQPAQKFAPEQFPAFVRRQLARAETVYSCYEAGPLGYLDWLAEDEPTRKRQRFDQMAKGWAIGTKEFVQGLAQEQRELRGQGRRLALQMRETHEALWGDELERLLQVRKRTQADLINAGKSADGKVALAANLKSRTTVTNRWLATNLRLRNLHETNRKISAWRRQDEAASR